MIIALIISIWLNAMLLLILFFMGATKNERRN